ncbi:MAG: 4-hydroxyacetophenone monooxygenase [Acidobacteriota bacterium]|nr:4-hydroxyacetophenone monooxygenase [Acidobacteriota bacterium]
MTTSAPTGNLEDDDRVLREALRYANVPTLLMVLVQMTGELAWLDDPYRPKRTRGISDGDSGGLAPELQEEIRDEAFRAISSWRRGRPLGIPEPSDELLLRMMRLSTGEDVPNEYAAMMATELGMVRSDYDLPPLSQAPNDFTVVVIGAGMSGICAGVYLQEAGISYTIFERSAGLGGTWFENGYPGVGVDTPNHLYSFSFAPHDWKHYYAGGSEVREYLEKVADDFHVRENIELRSEVVSASYDAEAQQWTVIIRREDGAVDSVVANAVITAVGAFTRPKTPNIDGLEEFAGPSFHAANWPPGLDLHGLSVGVVGNGATAMQTVPAIVEEAKDVTVFQRSPQWVVPFEKFQLAIPEGVRYLLESVPLYQKWYRLRLGWIHNDRLWPALQKDPNWPHPERAVNGLNDIHRRNLTEYVASELGDREDLLKAVLPDYPPFGKRILLDNGWFRALTRDNVRLVTNPIARIVDRGVVTVDGDVHTLDVLVLATGYDVVRFLSTVDVHGRSGTSLREAWDDDDARAYLGLAIPDFPNLFCIYGPNTQTGHGGSIMFITECQMHYIMHLLRQMLSSDLGAVEVREDVHKVYNDRVDTAHAKMVWTHPGMTTYYRNSRGRVVVNNPFRVVDYWHMTRAADLDDYMTEPARRAEGVTHADTYESRSNGPVVPHNDSACL